MRDAKHVYTAAPGEDVCIVVQDGGGTVLLVLHPKRKPRFLICRDGAVLPYAYPMPDFDDPALKRKARLWTGLEFL